MRTRSRSRQLTAEGLRAIVRRELHGAGRGRKRGIRESTGAGIDWNSESGRAIDAAISDLTGAFLEHFLGDDVEQHDAALPEVNNAIVDCVEKLANEIDWSGWN